MNYRKYSEDELRDYGIWKETLPNIKKEIELLEEVALPAIDYSDDRVDGSSGKDNVDILLSKLMEKEHKLETLEFIEGRMEFIESALSRLNEEERYVLNSLYVKEVAKAPRELEEEMYLSERQIQRIRNQALTKYTKYRVGLVEI